MNLKLIYKTAYGDKQPFETKNKSRMDFLFSTILVDMIEELSEKKDEISFIGLFLCYLDNAGLDLNDLEYCLNQQRESKIPYSFDSLLYSNFSENKLYDEIQKVNKIMPNLFSDILPTDVRNIEEEYFSYSKLLLALSKKEYFTDIVYSSGNKKDKYLDNTKQGKSLIKFLESFYSLNDIQQDYTRLVSQIVKDTRIKPKKVYDIMQKMLDSCTSRKVEIAQHLYKSTPKAKTLNKTVLSNGVVVKTSDEQNDNWKKIVDLPKHVIGQDDAVKKVMDKIMGSYVGFKSEKEPVATFLLTGPTGVGKTETAKAVADLCFEGKMFTVDMTTFKSDADISRLLGGSPNYVGYGDVNAFCDFIENNPHCVLLFDEIDKASKGCLDLLMRMIDEGEFINAKGKVISLRDAVIVCTTNLTEYVEDKTSVVEEKITNKDGLRKEIVGRFSEVVEYTKLSKTSCKKIAKKFFLDKAINNFQARNQDKNLILKYDDSLLDKIVEEANTELLGARDLKKSIQTNFITPVSMYVLQHDPKNTTLYVDENGVKETKIEKTSSKAQDEITNEA